jgi:hypothetical protein
VRKRCWDNGKQLHTWNSWLSLLVKWTVWTSITNYVACVQCFKLLNTLLNCKLYCDNHVHYNVSWGLNTSDLINYNMFTYTVTDSLMTLYNALLRYELQHTSVPWNFIILTHSFKLRKNQRKYMALCHGNSFVHTCNNKHENILATLNLPLLQSKQQYFDALFLISVYKKK